MEHKKDIRKLTGKQLIFLDIDGTLTEPGSNVPPRTALQAIRMARRKGHDVFLCTGRNYDMIRPLLQYGFDGIIASSGGYILYHDDIVYDCPMTEEQRIRSMKVLKEHGIFRTVECRDGSYTDEGFKEFLRENRDQKGNSEFLRWREQIEASLGIRPMAEYENQPIYKIVMMSTSMEPLNQVREILGDEFVFCIQSPGENGIINGELIRREFDKGKAVKRICCYLQHSIENTVGFGDSMNDKEMLEAVGFGVCMENGSEEVKKLADAVCPEVTSDGLYHGFQQYGLI